jgi:acetyl-CoA acetyltransferase
VAASDTYIEKRAAITGVGQSEIGRRLARDPFELTLDACLAAIADAGLTPADIDGLSTYPGMAPAGAKGFTGGGAYDVIDALRLNVNWYDSGLETSGQLGSVMKACLAVGAGLANHVVCYRSVWEGSAQGTGGRASIGMGAGGEGYYATGFQQWTLPFASASAACWIAMYAQAHMHRYGTKPEQLAQIALNARRNAALNPNAIYRDPLTLDDYFASRMITSPLRLFDCDVPCDGGTAVVVSRLEAAGDTRKTPLRVEAIGAAMHDRPSWDQPRDLTRLVGADAAAQMWSRTDLTPADVQFAELYDGFSILSMLWLEALGLCPVGESGPFVEGGKRIARDGELPLNTHGGQLSGGRLHGYGFLHEACIQLWGEGGERQVAKPLEVAAVAAGGGNTCGCMLITKAR